MNDRAKPSTLPQSRVVQVDDLTVRFVGSERTVEAVRNLSFHVDRGETLAIVGESGSGKSVTSLELVYVAVPRHMSTSIPQGLPRLVRHEGFFILTTGRNATPPICFKLRTIRSRFN